MKELLLPEASGTALFSQVGPFFLTCIGYLAAINLFAFWLMGQDKHLAKKKTVRRIPEKTLFLAALLGGSIGAITGMYTFRHKTKHWYFVMGMPLILAAQLALAVFILI